MAPIPRMSPPPVRLWRTAPSRAGAAPCACALPFTRRAFLSATARALGLAILGPLPAWAFTIISEAQEAEIGRGAHPEILKEYGLYDNPALQSYVSQVGQRVGAAAEARGIRYHFTVLDHPEVNAFALPGGYIYVHRGLLAELNSEAELAGVLGHEVGHVTARHGAKLLTKAVGVQALVVAITALSPGGREHAGQWALVLGHLSKLVVLGYGRGNEMEADELGLRSARGAGYDPRGLVLFLRHLRVRERLRALGYHGFAGTHPDTAQRIVKADTFAGILADQGGPGEGREDAYKAQLEGLATGDKRAPGRLRIYTARPGDTVATVARDQMGDPHRAWDLAVFNDLREDAVLREGQKIKLLPEEGPTRRTPPGGSPARGVPPVVE